MLLVYDAAMNKVDRHIFNSVCQQCLGLQPGNNSFVLRKVFSVIEVHHFSASASYWALHGKHQFSE